MLCEKKGNKCYKQKKKKLTKRKICDNGFQNFSEYSLSAYKLKISQFLRNFSHD